MTPRIATLALVAALSLPLAASADPPPYLPSWGSRGSGNGQFAQPRGIAVGSDGSVYVADTDPNCRVQQFSSSGAFIRKWGTIGSGNGQFTLPEDVGVDSQGNVYVTDRGPDRIQKFTGTGTYITQWGSYGSGDGQFNSPLGVAIDASDNVYVVETNNHRVQKFSNDGTFLTKWGSQGTGNGQFFAPYGVAVDQSGSVYVADLQYDIQKFTDSGGFVARFDPLGSGPHGLAFDTDDRLYAALSASNRIQVFTTTGAPTDSWGTTGSGPGQFNSPGFVAVGPDGSIYVTDVQNYRIQKFGPVPTSVLHSSWGRMKSLYR